MRRPFVLLAGILFVGGLTLPVVVPASASAADGGGKGDKGFTISDPRITESSGLAASRQHPGIYWTHNDQDTGAYLYAVDSATGKTVARITMTGVGTPRDVEAIAIGPGNEIWVGDIGDNDGVTWPYVWIYKLPEPKVLEDRSVKATQYVVKYTDGSRDAESMVVHPKTGRVYIIDKQEDGGHLYEGPTTLSSSGTNVFKPVKAVDLWATDAAFSRTAGSSPYAGTSAASGTTGTAATSSAAGGSACPSGRGSPSPTRPTGPSSCSAWRAPTVRWRRRTHPGAAGPSRLPGAGVPRPPEATAAGTPAARSKSAPWLWERWPPSSDSGGCSGAREPARRPAAAEPAKAVRQWT